jgi:membrane protein YdbS with pleckstrin-like domain
MPTSKRKPKLDLELDELAVAEFEYIAHTATQANEDRTQMTTFYFVAVGSVVAAILGTQFAADTLRSVSIAFAILFAMLTIFGAVTIAQLARLRAAWHESVEAMNQMKDFYLKHHPEFTPAFKWRSKTIPPTDKPYSIANLMAIQVALLGAVTTAASSYFLLFSYGDVSWPGYIAVAILFIGGWLAQWAWYKKLLVDDR